MMGLIKNIVVGTLILATLFVLGTCSVKCANACELSIGTSFIDGSHSEGSKTRCMNTGFGVDLGYEVKPLDYELHKLLNVSLNTGVLATYSNFETAYRATSRSPESDMKR